MQKGIKKIEIYKLSISLLWQGNPNLWKREKKKKVKIRKQISDTYVFNLLYSNVLFIHDFFFNQNSDTFMQFDDGPILLANVITIPHIKWLIKVLTRLQKLVLGAIYKYIYMCVCMNIPVKYIRIKDMENPISNLPKKKKSAILVFYMSSHSLFLHY